MFKWVYFQMFIVFGKCINTNELQKIAKDFTSPRVFVFFLNLNK